MDAKFTFEDLLEGRKNSLDGFLGIELLEVNEQTIIMTMPITPKIHQPTGFVHGGIYLAMAESAAGLQACYITDLSKYFPVGIENSASHLRSVKDGNLKATATLAWRSRSFSVHTVEIQHIESEVLLSLARVTNYFKAIV